MLSHYLPTLWRLVIRIVRTEAAMADSRIAVVDDHPLFRNALAEVLRSGDDGASFEITEAGSLEEMLARLEAGHETDLLMLDLGLPGLHGLLGVLSVRCTYPAIPIVVVSARAEPHTIGCCLLLGAAAYVPKSATRRQIREAVRVVLAGDKWVPEGADPEHFGGEQQHRLLLSLRSLSPRELQVCLALGRGLLNKQIAYELGIAEATVKAHVSRILEKLNASSRLHAVVMLQQLDSAADTAGAALEAAH